MKLLSIQSNCPTLPKNKEGILIEQAAKENHFAESTLAMQGTVQLRGAIHPEGSIASFYNNTEQNNLIALLFEMPEYPVTVGESWEIDFNFTSMGFGFIPENIYKNNHVQLSEITQTDDGHALAIIDYAIVESIEGEFTSSFNATEASTVSIFVAYIGQGQFLIDEGRWYHQLVGELTVSSSGFMSTNSTQTLALIPLETVPEAYTDLR